VAHIYNTALVVSLTVHIWQPILDGQCWLLDCDEGCNRLELVHNMHQLCVEWFLIPLGIFCRYFSNVQILLSVFILFFSMACQPLGGLGRLIFRGFAITHFRHTTLGRTPLGEWPSDKPVAETSTWQHTTLTRDRHPCPRPDSNPQSQQASGRRPTPTARPLGSAPLKYNFDNYCNSWPDPGCLSYIQ
jgi:hypothetical protein